MIAYAEYCLIQQIAKEADPKKDELEYLSVEEMKLVLEQPDIKKKSGIRDKFYLALLYDSGCRNQEILDLKIKDFVITGAGAKLHIVGKGRKYRVTPISKDVIKLFQGYCNIYHPDRKMDDWILFFGDFRSCAPIICKDSVASYNFLELTDEVLGQTETGLPDLRIYSGEGEVPYTLVAEQDFPATAKVNRAEILNQGKDSQGNLQFEVAVPTCQLVRQLIFLSSDKNFIRKVKVEGSHNQQDWLTLTDDSTIFDLTDEQKARHLEVNLTPTNFCYLRITIFNEGKGNFHFDGLGLSAQMETEVAAEKKERPYKLLTQSSKDGVQEYTLDLLQPHLPSEELEVITDAVNFNRPVELYASENIKGFNPLLVFPADRTKKMVLYWGNSEMIAPVYDIQKFKGNLDYFKNAKCISGPYRKK